MRGALFQTCLFLAVAATAGLAFVVLRQRPGAAGPDAPPEPADSTPPPPDAPPEPRLRPFQTADTLREDLRDALALPPDALDAECWRVSGALERVARWTLANLAPGEASPRVRALLVLAAGVHVPADPSLRAFLDDRDGLVRAAAALAAGYRPDGTVHVLLLDAVRVPLGRAEVRDLAARHAAETDENARAALRAVLDAAGLSPPR